MLLPSVGQLYTLDKGKQAAAWVSETSDTIAQTNEVMTLILEQESATGVSVNWG
ncbi:hypothetical protein P4S72_02355 [Vibrio sp. PP-XX7]